MPETVVHFQIRIPPDIHERLASWAKEDKRSLNGHVAAIFQRNSVAGTELIEWLRGIVLKTAPTAASAN